LNKETPTNCLFETSAVDDAPTISLLFLKPFFLKKKSILQYNRDCKSSMDGNP